MTGTVKVKDSSSYKYRGLVLPIIGINCIYTNPAYADIYPIGSIEYKLSLVDTEWADHKYTIIHDSHLEDIQITEGEIVSEIWFDNLNIHGVAIVNNIFNKDGSKTKHQIYTEYLNQIS